MGTDAERCPFFIVYGERSRSRLFSFHFFIFSGIMECMDNENKGKFIVIEGGDGSGKDAQVASAIKELHSENIIFTREPGGTRVGNEIRKLLLNEKSFDMKARTELLLFYASRAQHVEEVIAPALNAGQNVVSNRFSLSTIAYQIYGRKQPEYLTLCETLDNAVVGNYKPDFTVFLDIDPKHAMEKIRGRVDENNRFDDEDIEFYERVREGYLAHLKKIPHKIIDVERPFEEVQKEVLTTIREFLGQAGG
jgi:dTMP kinase